MRGILRSLGYYLFNEWVSRVPFHSIRRFFVRMAVGGLGEGSTILMHCEFRDAWKIRIGRNVVINSRVLLDGRGGELSIGDNVDIAQETNIWTLEHDPHSDHHQSRGAAVVIEDYAWIASRCTILPGVRIGRGAVVASNSVVTRDVEPMTIVAGIPAKAIGVRKSGLKYQLAFEPWFR